MEEGVPTCKRLFIEALGVTDSQRTALAGCQGLRESWRMGQCQRVGAGDASERGSVFMASNNLNRS